MTNEMKEKPPSLRYRVDVALFMDLVKAAGVLAGILAGMGIVLGWSALFIILLVLASVGGSGIGFEIVRSEE